jgi:hypothetical protein
MPYYASLQTIIEVVTIEIYVEIVYLLFTSTNRVIECKHIHPYNALDKVLL